MYKLSTSYIEKFNLSTISLASLEGPHVLISCYSIHFMLYT